MRRSLGRAAIAGGFGQSAVKIETSPFGGNNSPFDDVLQFPDIAWLRVALQAGNVRGREGG